MRERKSLTIWLFIFLVLTVLCWEIKPSYAYQGFHKVVSRYGAELWEHDAEETYVQVIDLSKGAYIKFFVEDIAEAGGTGIFGGENPEFNKKDTRDIWNENMSLIDLRFSLSNGVHFESMLLPTTQFAYPVRINSVWLSGGTKKFMDNLEGTNSLKMLEIWNNEKRAKIRLVYSIDTVVDGETKIHKINATNSNEEELSYAPNVLVGGYVDPNPDNSSNDYRNMIGLKDGNGDGNNEIILILTAKSLTIQAAVQTLISFGVVNSDDGYDDLQVVAFDGGGSTQLMAIDSNGERQEYIRQSRNIPQSIGVFAHSSDNQVPSAPTNLRIAQ